MKGLYVPKPRQTRGSGWGVAAGLASSLCCLGPSTAILFGLGSSSLLFSVAMEQRWALVIGGALLLGGAIRARMRSQAHPVCRGGRWQPMLVMLVTWVVSYSVLGGLLPQLAARRADQEDAPRVAATTPAAIVAHADPTQVPVLHRLTLVVEKMTCPPCAAKVGHRLRGKPAVHAVQAEAYNEEVIITYDRQQVTGEALMNIIPRDYGVTFVRDEPLP